MLDLNFYYFQWSKWNFTKVSWLNAKFTQVLIESRNLHMRLINHSRPCRTIGFAMSNGLTDGRTHRPHAIIFSYATQHNTTTQAHSTIPFSHLVRTGSLGFQRSTLIESLGFWLYHLSFDRTLNWIRKFGKNMVLSQRIHEAFKGTVERITGPRTVSAFKEKGVLSVSEFILAGDNLVSKCPTWSWYLHRAINMHLYFFVCNLL